MRERDGCCICIAGAVDQKGQRGLAERRGERKEGWLAQDASAHERHAHFPIEKGAAAVGATVFAATAHGEHGEGDMP